MGFLEEFDKVVVKENLGGEIDREYYRTGIDYVDYTNGKLDKNGNPRIGISGGKIWYVAGPSGSAKSSLAIQAGFNIIDQFEDGLLCVQDAEKSNSHERIAMLSGYSEEVYNEHYRDKRVKLVNDYVTSEGLFKYIENLHRKKMEYYSGLSFTKKGRDSSFSKDTLRTKSGEIPPSVIIVDSWAMLPTEAQEESTEQRGNMAAAAIAKSNNGLIKQITGRLFEANIILIIVNHLSVGINIGFIPKDLRDLKFLRENETLPAGKTAVYEADLLHRVEQKKALKPDKDFGIKGFIMDATICKSRSNTAGTHISMVFDQQRGISNVLTNFLILKEANKIKGSGRGYFIESCPDVKFTQKKILETYNENEEFAKAFDTEIEEIFSTFLYRSEIDGELEELEEQPRITASEIRSMNKKKLEELCEVEGLELDWDEYPGKEGLKEAKEDIISVIFEEE